MCLPCSALSDFLPASCSSGVFPHARPLGRPMRPVSLLSFQHVTKKTIFLVFCNRSRHPQYGRQRYLSLTMTLPITLHLSRKVLTQPLSPLSRYPPGGPARHGHVIREPSVPSAITCFFWMPTRSLLTEAWTVSLHVGSPNAIRDWFFRCCPTMP